MQGAGNLAADNLFHVMNDFIYLGITVAFFVLCGLYARGCETL